MYGLVRSLIAALLLVFAAGAAPAAAQTPMLDAAKAATEASGTSAPTGAELRALVETLQDEAARNKLISQLNAMIAARRAAAGADAVPAGAGARVMAALSLRI